jgi:hypothetical protein
MVIIMGAITAKNPGVPRKIFEQAAKEWKERQRLEKEYKTHDVFHIQDWQEVVFIPGGTRLLRTQGIFDATTGKAFIKKWNKEIGLIEGGKEAENFRRILKHPRKSAAEGKFARRLILSPLTHLVDLLLIINQEADLVMRPSKGQNLKDFKKNMDQFIGMVFDLVINEK